MEMNSTKHFQQKCVSVLRLEMREKRNKAALAVPQERAPLEEGAVMARMRAVDAAVLVLEREGINCAFGVPGAAINPFYSAMKARGSIRHVLARHVEGASHMAEAIPAQSMAISACASVHLVQPERT